MSRKWALNLQMQIQLLKHFSHPIREQKHALQTISQHKLLNKLWIWNFVFLQETQFESKL